MEFKKSNEINKKELFWKKDDLFKITINNNLKNNNEIPQEFFLDKLNEHYLLYKEKWNSENKEWMEFWKNRNNKNKKNKKIINPENQFIRSPLTIIDAPWGAGKTFFVEQLVKQWDCILSDRTDIKFKNIAVIDLWQYFYHNTDPVLQFTNLFYKNVIEFLCPRIKQKKFLKFIKKLFIPKFQNYKCLFWIFKNIKDVYGKTYLIDKKVESLIKKIKPTIVVLDNIERLENYSMEIIKIICLYSCFPNFMFVLPMNKSAFKINNFENKGESWIDKYVSLNVWFEYQQDYSQLLKKYNIDNEYIDELNKILNQPREDENNIKYVLTMRELEKILNKYDFKNKYSNDFTKNRYKFFLMVNKFIWPNNVLSSEVDIFIELFKEIDLNEVTGIVNYSLINSLNSYGNYDEKELIEIRNKINFLLSEGNFICINFNCFEKMFFDIEKYLETKIKNANWQLKYEFKNIAKEIYELINNFKKIDENYVLNYINKIYPNASFNWNDFLYIWNFARKFILKSCEESKDLFDLKSKFKSISSEIINCVWKDNE